jgi:hypothetical protein
MSHGVVFEVDGTLVESDFHNPSHFLLYASIRGAQTKTSLGRNRSFVQMHFVSPSSLALAHPECEVLHSAY